MRSVADSNRCSWFCRPVTKPLIQPTILKWYHQESNRGHKDFQSFALPTELWHHTILCTEDETRTHTAERPLPPQSSVSTNFTTSASEILSEKRDSNPRPRPWQGRALPTELFSHFLFYRTSLEVLRVQR